MSTAGVMTTTQYLTFKLDNESFALDISKVREVLDFITVTRVPRMPQFMLGVINLRGSVMPVIDLRLKLGMTKTEKTMNTCIIITEVNLDDETVILGALADSVEEVMELDANHIEPAPQVGTMLRNDFIKGMGKQQERFVIILDVDRIFSSDEIACLQV